MKMVSKIHAGKPATLTQGQTHCKIIYFSPHHLSFGYTHTILQACSLTSSSTPDASVQDLATFTPCQGYLVPVSHSLAASKCHSVLATAVSSRCSLTVASQGCIFLPLCSVTLCFTSEVFVGSLPGHCFQAGSQLKVPCFPASCQQVPFSLLKVFAAAGGRGRRLSRVCTGKGRVG